MKKVLCLLLALMILAMAAGCSSNEEQVKTVGQFSYVLAQAHFKDQEEGVMHSGFRNITPNPIQDANHALKLAKNECVISYDSFVVSYDENTQMYCVCFYKENVDGGDQLVYMDSNGITKLVVFGK